MDNNNWLQQLLTLGIGTTAIVAEKIKEVSDEWVRTGRLDPEQARKLVDDLMARVQGETGQSPSATFEAQIQQQLKRVMMDLGVPQQSEMDELRGRLDRLERQVRDLENRLWR
jgi:polyhydroxyalkanoate synthesis regulator phasin